MIAKTLAAILVAAVAVPVAGLTAERTREQDQDLEKRVEALEKALEDSKAQRSKLEADLAAERTRIDRIETWTKTLPAACAALQKAALDARENGFEYAGPNPLAKKQVLDGLTGFAAALSAKLPAASADKPADEDKKPERGRGRARAKN